MTGRWQIPIFETRSDGRDNFLVSLLLAGQFTIPEVSVFFNHELYRGNRTTKISTDRMNAFGSPNLTPLASVGIEIEGGWGGRLQCSIRIQFTGLSGPMMLR